MDIREKLRRIPKVDDILAEPAIEKAGQTYGHDQLLSAVRQVLDIARSGLLDGSLDEAPAAFEVSQRALALLAGQDRPSLRQVVNATGIILHTNLGRAPLAACAVQAVVDTAKGYSNLEYNLEAGLRGSRHSHVDALLCELTGAEAAMVVNNNAAAVLLALSALAKGKEVVVSRGELVEIGGAFRVPDIMALSGAVLHEVGTTNRTHPSDYKNAIGPDTGALFKAHTSNFKLEGFTKQVSLSELANIAADYNLPVIYDMGSGWLLPELESLLPDDPGVSQSLQAGVDILCMSGDKLLGGPQAGIVLGQKKYIDGMKAHPLARALRVDKMTLSGLETTLRLYRNPQAAAKEIPSLACLLASEDSLLKRAGSLAKQLSFLGEAVSVVESQAEVGAGSAPVHKLKSFAVALNIAAPNQAEEFMRGWRLPIIARISKQQLLLDLRTVSDEDFDEIAACLKAYKAAEVDI